MSFKIGLDAGHGLYTSGKQTPDGIKEWTLNDKVCDKIERNLKEYDVVIIRTDNNEGNIDESLAARVKKYIDAGVNVFVSVHHNALKTTWSNATGVETYTDNNPTAEDVELAKLIQTKLVKYTGLTDRGVKKADFTVIKQNKVTAVLVEGGFMDGTNDYKIITSDAGQENYAKAVSEALIEKYKLTKKPTGPQWIQDDKGWWYRHADGSYTKNAWEKINNKWYYFDNNGYALQNKWQEIKGEWYYFDNSCAALQNKWEKIDNKWYYFNDDCAAVKGFNQISGKDYYFAENSYKNIDKCQLIMTDNNGMLRPTV